MDLNSFKEQVKDGFSKCLTDISLLKEENDELKELISKILNENSILKEKLEINNKEIFELKSQVKGFEIALNLLKDFMSNSSNIQNKVDENVEISKNKEILKINNKKENILTEKDPYEALLAFKAKTNKKSLLKKKILSLITDNGIAQNELKFMFVDHYKYCSKATFYNYLKELEIENKVELRRVNSKNMIFLTEKIENILL
jgi:hypothetical protein